MDWKGVLLGSFNRRRLMTDLWLLPLTMYVVLALYAWFSADRQIFLPQPCSYEPSAEHLFLPTSDGETLCAIHLPNPEARYTLLYSHGNAEDLGDILPEMEALRRGGFAVFAYDYRGYGLSTGSPSTKGACLDVAAAYRYLTETLSVPPGRVVAYGRSVGGGPAVHLAAREPIGGLILQSTFTSAFVVVTRIPILPFDRFRNLAQISAVRCPVFVMHGRRDRVIPFSHGLKLYARAPEPKRCLWVEAGHNSFPGDDEAKYWEALREFASVMQAAERQADPDRSPSAGVAP